MDTAISSLVAIVDLFIHFIHSEILFLIDIGDSLGRLFFDIWETRE